PAGAMVSAGHSAVYGYRFDWDEQGSFLVTDLSRLLGAAHGLEIPFVFDSFDSGLMSRIAGRGENPERDALARTMRDYWAEFARTGDPRTGGKEHPTWAPWSPQADGPKFIALDSASDRGIRMSSEALTREAVLDGLAEDARFADAAERCRYMEALVSFDDLEPAEYEARGCAAYPLPNVASK
ncbi:MAG: carboxylesterase family protein, partial [Myxococcales bacterium]|nr:carboxylesterase family protein [Myxococcales bacterium]